MKSLLLTLAFMPALSFAQGCFGPGGCDSVAILPTGPVELCVADSCTPVDYSWTGDMAIASTTLSNGYQVIGWSGPCKSIDRSQCPDILNQAHRDLTTNALRINRAVNF